MVDAARIAVTGMSINTPLGDRLDDFLAALLAGRSAIQRWRAFPTERIYSKVGGDLTGYDAAAKLSTLAALIPQEVHKRLRRLATKGPWSTRLSALLAVDAWADAGLFEAGYDPDRQAVIVAGHNINSHYNFQEVHQFDEEPDLIDGLASLYNLDTDHAGTVSEILQARGPIYTTGAACASGNLGLRNAVDEIRYHGAQTAIVVGAVLDFAPIDVHAMALMGAISYRSFNDEPASASRPYDVRREGFVPSHGGAALVLEELGAARRRGARVYAEVLGVEAGADGNHLPQPDVRGQTRVMRRALQTSRLEPSDVDYISAHATSTPLGDLTELTSIKTVFGDHAPRLKVNAPKSLLGHTCWAAPTVETVAGLLQMQAGQLHPSINIDELDPAVDLDVCHTGAATHQIEVMMKNSFGFGGINCVAVFRRLES